MGRTIRESIDLQDLNLEEVENVDYSTKDNLYVEIDNELYFVLNNGSKIPKGRIKQELKSLDSPSANDKLQRLRDRTGDSGN